MHVSTQIHIYVYALRRKIPLYYKEHTKVEHGTRSWTRAMIGISFISLLIHTISLFRQASPDFFLSNMKITVKPMSIPKMLKGL